MVSSTEELGQLDIHKPKHPNNKHRKINPSPKSYILRTCAQMLLFGSPHGSSLHWFQGFVQMSPSTSPAYLYLFALFFSSNDTLQVYYFPFFWNLKKKILPFQLKQTIGFVSLWLWEQRAALAELISWPSLPKPLYWCPFSIRLPPTQATTI